MNIRQIKETCLYINDLNKTEDFYADKLNLKVIGRVENRHIFFRAGSSVLLCFRPEATKNETGLPAHYGSGHMHIAFEVAPEDYATVKEAIRSKGIEIEHEQRWNSNYRSFYFRDPDGHSIEIVPEGMWD